MKFLVAIIAMIAFTSCSIYAAPLWVFKASEPIMAADVLDDSRQLVVVTRRNISILSAETGQEVGHISGIDADLRAIACNSTMCWVGGGEHEKGYLGVLDAQNRKIKRIATSDKFAAINTISIRADATLVTGHADESVILWDMKEMRPRHRLIVQGGLEIYAIRSIDGNIAIGNDKGDLALWDGQSELPTQRVNLGDGAIFSIAANDDYLLVGGWQYLDILNHGRLSDKQQIKFSGAAILVCESSDAHVALCGLSDGSLSWIEISGGHKTSLKLHSDGISFLKLLDGVVITGSKDKTVKAWKKSQVVMDGDK